MAVYVDRLFLTQGAPKPAAEHVFGFGRYSCHMTADTDAELHRFAAGLGLRRAWFQDSPVPARRHYDLTHNKRRLAVKLGAVELP